MAVHTDSGADHKASALASVLRNKGYELAQVEESRVVDQACDLCLSDAKQIQQEARQWISFAKDFQQEDALVPSKLQSLNEHLSKRSVLSSNGTTVSIVDVIVFAAVRDALVKLIPAHQDAYQNLVRWFDHVQHEVDVFKFYQRVPIKKPIFQPIEFTQETPRRTSKVVSTTTPAGDTPAVQEEPKVKETNSVARPDADIKAKGDTKKCETFAEDKAAKKSSKTKEKKEPEEKTLVQKKEADVTVSALDIRVGLVRKVWKHPSADSLLVEEIDVGELGVRQVVSGLAKFVKEEEMLNRKVVLIANVKPGKLRDVLSTGLVLCASDAGHEVVEPLIPPKEAVIGERITFTGHEGKPEDVLNSKKKQLEKISPDLVTDSNGIATYQGIPFMTSSGPCKASLNNAAIK